MDYSSYDSGFFESSSSSHQGPRRNIAQNLKPQIMNSSTSNMNFPDTYDIFGGGRYFGGLTAGLVMAPTSVGVATDDDLKVLEKYQKERQNVEEIYGNVKEWTERARASLKKVKQTFAEHLEKAFQDCEEFINKQANSVEVMKEVYDGCMRKDQMLRDGIHAGFNTPNNLTKATPDSAAHTPKVNPYAPHKLALPCLPALDKILPSSPPSVSTVSTERTHQATNCSSCSDLVKREPSSPASTATGVLKEFTPMKMKLNYDVNFGSFGIEDGQFSEPAGICVTSEGLIAVTDTKNHRVQVFDEIGCLKLAFGVSGSNPGQLLYPNCIASCPVTGNFVITERTPVHQIQVYSSCGHYIRRFGQNLIQFPRGVTVDKCGNIIVVECKVMRVTIFDQLGNVIRTFCAPSVMSFPMDICVNDNHEIFIVDNRRHSVHVFDYNGNNLRSMCGNGSISFPISVSINAVGELVVTDNHQSFNMTFFTQKGELVRAYESRNRHLQCLASTVHGVDKIFLATKDFRVYMYDCSKGKCNLWCC